MHKEYFDGIVNFPGRVITEFNGDLLYYSKRWSYYVDFYTYCIEDYVCCTCSRQGIRTQGFSNFDSLVVCKDHYKTALKLHEKLRAALSIPNKDQFDQVSKKIDHIVDNMEVQ